MNKFLLKTESHRAIVFQKRIKKFSRELGALCERIHRHFQNVLQYVADTWYSQFIEEMEKTYSEFHTLWNESEVSSAPEVLIEFRHAKAGKMVFNLTSFQVQGNSDLRCSVYTPVDHTETEAKLKSSSKTGEEQKTGGASRFS